MLNPVNDLLPSPSSPTISTRSSSDLDTESTRSFFHDRSTTLGTLMGVTLQAITFRAVSQHCQQENHPVRNNNPKNIRAAARRRRGRRRRWWRLCRDESDSRRASLGDYLEGERRFGDAAGLPTLFADGRVLPPVAVAEDSSPAAAALCRFSVERCCSLVL